MILIDTSIWADHLHRPNELALALLNGGEVLMHPFVIGEIALGNLRNREEILLALAELPTAVVAEPEEVLDLIEGRGLAGSGIGYVDAHLAASCLLTPDCRLWTRDARLARVAASLEIAPRLHH